MPKADEGGTAEDGSALPGATLTRRAARAAPLPPAGEAFERFAESDQRRIGTTKKAIRIVRDNLRIGRNSTREMISPDSVVVERRCFDGGKPAGTATLHVRREAAPDDWFTVPAGYAKADMMVGR